MSNATAGNSAAKRELIAFRVADQEFCVDIMQVRDIRGWTPTTAIPHSPHYVRGLINLRGAVLPVIDLAARFGLPTTNPTSRNVIVFAETGRQTVGLLVDAVSDILTVVGDAIQATPDVASDVAKNFVEGLLTIEGRMVGLIGLDRIIPSAGSEAA
jgi:purine-binding chemotaxis protein CheW